MVCNGVIYSPNQKSIIHPPSPCVLKLSLYFIAILSDAWLGTDDYGRRDIEEKCEVMNGSVFHCSKNGNALPVVEFLNPIVQRRRTFRFSKDSETFFM